LLIYYCINTTETLDGYSFSNNEFGKKGKYIYCKKSLNVAPPIDFADFNFGSLS